MRDFSEAAAVPNIQMHTFTTNPPGWTKTSTFSRSNKFPAKLKTDSYPGAGTYNAYRSTLLLPRPSKTRVSNFARRGKETKPMEGTEAMMSLHGLDHLDFEPVPDCGTYAMPIGSFQAAGKKGRGSSIYKSATARFPPTRTTEDTSLRLTGRAEVRSRTSPRKSSILGTTAMLSQATISRMTARSRPRTTRPQVTRPTYPRTSTVNKQRAHTAFPKMRRMEDIRQVQDLDRFMPMVDND